MRLRIRLHQALEGRPGAGLTHTQRVSAALIVFSVVLAIVASEPVLAAGHEVLLRCLEWTLGTAFAIEYIARAYAIGADPRYAGVRGLARHLFRPISLLDLVSILSFFVGIGSEAFILRLIRIFRLLALSCLARYSAALDVVTRSVYSRRHELVLAVAMACCMVLFSASALYVVEAEAQPNSFGSIPRAIWWAVSTLTTVGYGDVVPITPLGKLFSALTAIAGIGLIAMPTGILAAAFSEAFARVRAKEAESAGAPGNQGEGTNGSEK